MKKLTSLLFSFLFVSFLVVFIISCGGSEEFETTSDMYPESMVSNTNCAPPNLKLDVAINRKFCGSDDCLLSFAGYRWWTNYQFTGPPNYFWNNGSGWSPRNVFVDGEGLHLMVKQDDLGDGMKWRSAEVCLVYEGTGTKLANMDYGTYLVSARIKSSATFDLLDKNVAFGLFTYEKDKTGDSYNPARELDLAEVSRWGVPPASNTDSKYPFLATGSSQFALQDWTAPGNVHRYDIPSVKEITLVMYWPGPKQQVEFRQYNGIYTIENLPPESQATNKWKTAASQNNYIPADGCQRWHMNLWMGNFGQGKDHPGPSNGQNQEVVVTNFQYKR